MGMVSTLLNPQCGHVTVDCRVIFILTNRIMVIF